jgi:hypothetical protein
MEGVPMGQSSPFLPMAERVWQLADLLDHMIEQVGVSGAAGRLDGGEGLRRAAKICMRCNATAKCERFLAAAQPDDEIPLFCPNRPYLLRCRELTRLHAQRRAEEVAHRGC